MLHSTNCVGNGQNDDGAAAAATSCQRLNKGVSVVCERIQSIKDIIGRSIVIYFYTASPRMILPQKAVLHRSSTKVSMYIPQHASMCIHGNCK